MAKCQHPLPIFLLGLQQRWVESRLDCVWVGVSSDHGHDCCRRGVIAVEAEFAVLCLPGRLERVEESVIGVGIVGVSDAESGGFVRTDP